MAEVTVVGQKCCACTISMFAKKSNKNFVHPRTVGYNSKKIVQKLIFKVYLIIYIQIWLKYENRHNNTNWIKYDVGIARESPPAVDQSGFKLAMYCNYFDSAFMVNFPFVML